MRERGGGRGVRERGGGGGGEREVHTCSISQYRFLTERSRGVAFTC